jgi:hypothetical protein
MSALVVDSDDEEDPFMMFRTGTVVNVEDTEDDREAFQTEIELPDHRETYCAVIDELFLKKDLSGLEALMNLEDSSTERSCTDEEIECINLCIDVLEGRHLEVIKSSTGVLSVNYLNIQCYNEDAVDSIRNSILNHIAQGVDENSEYNALKCLITGVAYLEVYCQVNYTGPELSNSAIEPLITIPLDKREGVADGSIPTLHVTSVSHLESDGDYAFPICELPHTLLIARSILSALALPNRAAWRHGIFLTPTGV